MARRRPNLFLACTLLCGGMTGVAAPGWALAAGPEAAEPNDSATAPKAVPEPPSGSEAAGDASASSSPAEGSPAAETAPTGAPPADSGTAAPPAGDPTAVPEPPTPTDATAEPPADTVAAEPLVEEPEPAIDPSMLEAEEPEPERAPPPKPREVEYDTSDPEQVAAMVRAEYANLYRSDDIGPRLNIAARLMFANMGSTGGAGAGGRMGGGAVDIGAAWNRIGVAGTLETWAGRYFLPEETGAEMNAMFGGGPTLNYGRLALLGRGFFDFRIGYNFYYGVVGARRGGPAVVAQQDPDAGGVVLVQTENLLPHGPRVQAELGLMSHDQGKYFHGFGLTMGYQALVHSFRGDMPFTSMLTLGLAYWMG